jgi:uncharacterized repeat protein (TIGR03843 family)
MTVAMGDRERDSQGVSVERVLTLLREGELEEVKGKLPWGSNYSFLMLARDADLETYVVYKPRRGEQPLWDFPDGTLCNREVGAYLVSEALGWGIVPPTVLRDGPYGEGMVQLIIEADPNVNYFTLGPEFRPQLQRIALFDHIVNNADRKGGHCLLARDGRLWSIDHGICFHAAPKLRTVIWDFATEPIPADLLRDVEALCEKLVTGKKLHTQLEKLISEREIDALKRRVERLLDTGTYPEPGPGRNYPWPPV